MATIVLSQKQVNLFAKAMKMFHQFAREMNILWRPEGLVLQAVDQDERAFCEVKFKKESFINYHCEQNYACKVSVLPMVTFLGHRSLHHQVRVSRMIFNSEESKILVEITLENSRSRHLKIPIIADDIRPISLRELSTKMDNPTLRCTVGVLTEIWERLAFSEEITMWFQRNRILLKNFIEKRDQNYYATSVTEYSVSVAKLNSYNFTEAFTATFNLKTCLLFRTFAQLNNNQITAYFQSKGHPCELCITNTNEHYSARIRVISIDVPEADLTPPRIALGPSGDSQSGSIATQTQTQFNQSIDYPYTLTPSQNHMNISNQNVSQVPSRTATQTPAASLIRITNIPQGDSDHQLSSGISLNVSHSGNMQPPQPVNRSNTQFTFTQSQTSSVTPAARLSNIPGINQFLTENIARSTIANTSSYDDDDDAYGAYSPLSTSADQSLDQIDRIARELDQQFSPDRSRNNEVSLVNFGQNSDSDMWVEEPPEGEIQSPTKYKFIQR